MKLGDVLYEGISPVVYHWTRAHIILKILKQDVFKLMPYAGNSSELELGKKGKLFFMSTTRSKTGGYTSPNEMSGTMKLDGRKLAQNYKGSPVEYWGTDMRKVDQERRTTEMEDRIFNTKETIPRASKYIQEIHIKWPAKDAPFFPRPGEKLGKGVDRESGGMDNLDDEDKSLVRELLILSKKRGIPVYFYVEKKDFLGQNKSKAIKLDIKGQLKGEKPLSQGGSSWRMKRMATRDIGPYLELINTPAGRKLSDTADSIRSDIVWRDHDRKNYARNIETVIHNNKTFPAAAKITKFMQKEKLSNTTELIKWLQNKWTTEDE